MKPILSSFLGSLAAIGASIAIFFILLVGLIQLITLIAGSGGESVEKHSVLYLNLNSEINEYDKSTDIKGGLINGSFGEAPMTVNEIVRAIDNAASDDYIEMMFIECNNSSAGLAQRQSILEAVKRFRDSGKKVYAYGDDISQGDYYIASAADSIFGNPSCTVDIHGIAATNFYFKGLLDKLGVEMQIVKVGTYKSAVEPFSLTGPSEASVEQQQLYIGNIWKQVRDEIAANRKVKAEEVDSWVIDQIGSLPVADYVARKVIDATVYRHGMLDKLAALTDQDKPRLVDISQYVGSDRMHRPDGSKTIAVYNLEGDIVDDGNKGIVGNTVVEEILDLAKDDDIDALVLRVNSGGGSAFASEQIWDALETFKAETGKTVYVSMSDYAASGGYYISCGADRIYAQPTTLTGSIGIFGMIPDIHGLVTGKLGVNNYTVTSHPEGELPITIVNPMTPGQRSSMQAYVDRGYELFVKRVADGRGKSVDEIKAIAEGRVWDGTEALRIGLVDELGGLEDALAGIAKAIDTDDYKVVYYPEIEVKWWENLLTSGAIGVRSHAIGLSESELLMMGAEWVKSLNPLQARMNYVILN